MRCKACNKNVGKTYNGLCTACMSVRAKERNEKIEALMQGDGADLENLKAQHLEEKGGFARYINDGESTGTVRRTGASGRMSANGTGMGAGGKRKLSSLDIDYSIVKGEFTEKDKRAYKPTLERLLKKYTVMMKNGNYAICKKSEFGTGEIGGDIVEVKGGLIVFKNPGYYDPDKVVPDAYRDDNDELDSEDDSIELGTSDIE